MRRCLLVILFLAIGSEAHAQKKSKGDSSLELVPLVDMKAPLVAVWFVAVPKTPFEDAAAVEEQIYEDFFKRMDIRMLSREKTLELLGKSRNPDLQACDGADVCLFRIGKALKVDRMVGVIMLGSRNNYKIVLKCFDLERKPPGQLNSVVEGSLTELLIGGTADAVATVFENQDQYAPVDMRAMRKPRHPKSAAPEKPPKPKKIATAKPEKQPAKTPEVVEAAPPKPGFFEKHLWSTVAAGASVVTLLTGIGFGAAMLDIEGDWGTNQVWDADLDQRARTYALTANIFFGISGATAVAAVVLFFIEAKESDSPVTILPTGTGIEAVVRF